MMEPKSTDYWSGRVGVILAVAGSAVGLGNFLRFPGQVAEYGGGAFMIAYFVSLLIIGLPICWAEWTMGRYGGSKGFHSSPGIMHTLIRQRWGKYVGILGVLIPVIIYMYYVYIEAWCLGYAVQMFGGISKFANPEKAGDFFARFVGIAENGEAIGFAFDQVGIYLLIAFVVNFFLIYRGINKGIEWFCTYAMPALVVLAIIVLVRVLTLGTPVSSLPENNVNNGLGFMWNPTKVTLQEREIDARGNEKWTTRQQLVGESAIKAGEREVAAAPESKRIKKLSIVDQLFNPEMWLAAAGQIFFSLSVGFGVIITYASYLRQNDDVLLSGLSATSANEFCEVVLGGLITIPASVAFLGVGTVAGMASTFGLGFNVLPIVFTRMPLGQIFGFVFFFLLFLAAMTSSLSMLQPGIAFLEEALKIGRRASVAILSLVTAIGTGMVVFFSKDLKALDTMDFWVGTFLIFILATCQIFIFGWFFGVERGLKEAQKGSIIRVPKFFHGIIQYACPMFLITIFILWFLVNVLGYSFKDATSEYSSYVKDLLIEPNLVAQLTVAFILLVSIFLGLIIASSPAYRRINKR
ncbi:MAG: sodium:calcium symporter [Chthoniobacterales bacterium]